MSLTFITLDHPMITELLSQQEIIQKIIACGQQDEKLDAEKLKAALCKMIECFVEMPLEQRIA